MSHNVTLFSYVHLQFLIEKRIKGNLEDLWEIPIYISKNYKSEERKRGITYWHAIDSLVCEITKQPIDVLKQYKQQEIKKTKEVGQEGINYWTSKINEFKKLNREQAIKLLIRAEKIEQKIETIKKAIERVNII